VLLKLSGAKHRLARPNTARQAASKRKRRPAAALKSNLLRALLVRLD